MNQRARALIAEQLPLVFDAPSPRNPPQPTAPPPTTPHGLRTHRMHLGAEIFEFRLRRGKRRTIGFQIDDAGLTVSAPRWVSLRQIEDAVSEKSRWIHNKLAAWRQWAARRRLPQVQWADGGSLPYLGATLILRLSPHSGLVQSAHARELHLALPPEASASQIKDSAIAWLQSQAKQIFAQRIEALSEQNGKRPAAWALSSARAQWGSCTHDGRIRINWRLIHFTLPVIDYVIAHELAHLHELNHGPGFWHAVSRLLPGFEAARDEIKGIDINALPA